MHALVGKPAPDFTAPTVIPDDSISERFHLRCFQKFYDVLFLYPLDFTFVCPSEILVFDTWMQHFLWLMRRNFKGELGSFAPPHENPEAWDERRFRRRGGILGSAQPHFISASGFLTIRCRQISAVAEGFI